MCLFRISEAARCWAPNWRLSWPKLRLADGRSCTRAWRSWRSAAPGTRCRCTRRARRWRSSAISWPAPRCPQRRTPSGRPSAGARERQLDLKFFHFRFSQRCKCNSIGKKIRNKSHIVLISLFTIANLECTLVCSWKSIPLHKKIRGAHSIWNKRSSVGVQHRLIETVTVVVQ